MKLAVLASAVACAAAFAPSQNGAPASTALNAEQGRKEFLTGALATAGAFVAGAAPANAVRDYDNVAFLGGSQTVDVNNANVRVYLKMPGMYPGAAGKLAANGPYKSVADVYNIPGLTAKEKEVIKKYESRFVALPPSADYVIDRINNGLYR
uniref:Photosystem II 12 kDa extrinsic protein n=1 Tax=Pseudictyota dubia TaxID=2749911 RepID=A0A7R9W5B1_9STRA|mmetsp:Transcript_3438/g.6019  ORF Transcript_3438/g.6019 Transcript_3438/m.6019 type:complete len:152 (+) Transcript_3438:44-499(+)|eukprot:CAMPEP_0197435358 /NCGR_PEP_ID=MMETSP1175-20131217/2969_1 /TAXON_ID=1003142 /ORGANISM="Triceratium dubium, Strain CCMP147" /LENGTH=151 /DNA_ID=CAMNT_0042964385 /DNA_START=31 /DNA_END=486 /DNA_ORIENTATION=+